MSPREAGAEGAAKEEKKAEGESVVDRALSAATVEEMFELLIAAPLRRIAEEEKKQEVAVEHGAEQNADAVSIHFVSPSPSPRPPPRPPLLPCVIVLDALDELPPDSVQDVLQLIAEEFGKLPSFVRLFIAVCLIGVCVCVFYSLTTLWNSKKSQLINKQRLTV